MERTKGPVKRKYMFIYVMDLIGTCVFAISGCIVAYGKKFDLFGGFVLGAATAVGGGTIRDVLIGRTPVGWTQDINYLWAIVLGVVLSFFFRSYVFKLRKTMFLFDTIGISLFTILGVEITLELGLSSVIAVIMGTISAVFGGIIRDVLSQEVPLIFRKELYATACIAGATIYLMLMQVFIQSWIAISISVICIFILRVFSVKKHWSLPKMK